MPSIAHCSVRISCTLGVCAALVLGTPLFAQAQPPLLLVLDRSAVDYGDAPHAIPSGTVNEGIAAVGLREPLPYFAARVGETVTLPGGGDGADGWFALRQAPGAWSAQEGGDDGLENYFLAGSGLGSPDDLGDRGGLLRNVEGVTPLRSAGLTQLVGRTACVVVYSGNVAETTPGAATMSLAGPTLGVAAFTVRSVEATASGWAAVGVEVLDTRVVCKGALAAMTDAPAPE